MHIAGKRRYVLPVVWMTSRCSHSAPSGERRVGSNDVWAGAMLLLRDPGLEAEYAMSLSVCVCPASISPKLHVQSLLLL